MLSFLVVACSAFAPKCDVVAYLATETGEEPEMLKRQVPIYLMMASLVHTDLMDVLVVMSYSKARDCFRETVSGCGCLCPHPSLPYGVFSVPRTSLRCSTTYPLLTISHVLLISVAKCPITK